MFKKMTVYQLTQPVGAVIENLKKALPESVFAPCGKHAAKSVGFVSPLGPASDELIYEANGAVLFMLRTDVKKLPTAAIKELVSSAMRLLVNDGEDPSPVDERTYKEEIVEGLLPQTLASPSWTYAYIDRELSMMFVDASDDPADDFMKALSGAMKATPFELLGIEKDPSDVFTSWIRNPELLGENLRLGDACTLKQAGEGGTTLFQIQHENLSGEDIHTLITSGKLCCRIGLIHDDAEFAIVASLGLRSFTLSKNRDAEIGENEGPKTPSELAVMAVVIRGIINELAPLLGGWPTQVMLDLKDELVEEAA